MLFEALRGVFLTDLAVWLPRERVLAITDIHLGYEEALNKRGVMIPRQQFRDTVQRLERILNGIAPETVLINGDLKHEFGTISQQEWRDVLKFLDFLLRHAKRVVLIRGNHDSVLGPLAEKKGLELCDSYRAGKVLFSHGNRVPDIAAGVRTIVVGHEHPAVSVREGSRVEVFKCWLLGKWKGRDLLVMPSFNLMAEGTDILSERLLSPLLTDIEGFRVFAVSDEGEVLPFGTVADLRKA